MLFEMKVILTRGDKRSGRLAQEDLKRAEIYLSTSVRDKAKTLTKTKRTK